MHRHYTVGLRIDVAPPGNDFPLHEDARPAVLIAGGIGITPIRAMAHALRARGTRFALHYAARSARETAWAGEIARELGPRLSTYFAETGPRLDVEAVLRAAPADAVVYVCGPSRLIDAVHAAAARHGAAARVRCERFVPGRRDTDAPIAVELTRSSRRVDVRPDQTILEAVEEIGVTVPASCRNGTCGTCATKVLAGTPEHRDRALTAAERDRAGLMCICVSRAATPELALDL
ncbi:MAG: iron-sulfur cluster-binding domain-containing protein [Betaproteobacteria bacterium]|nr:iron-sulfur cluster-binding domain-containing protein [Betaproteobacteria bacterium]